MAILKIARMGHPVLRTPAVPVEDPTAPEVRHLIADMIETLDEVDGLGLAAPQVHVGLRVVIFHVPAERAGNETEEEPDGPQPLTVLVNPVVEPLDQETELDWEGCLSLPGLTGVVPRYNRIRYRALDERGEAIERLAEGVHARVVQHECDHLDGILYPQRMSDLTHFGFAEEIRRFGSGNEVEDD